MALFRKLSSIAFHYTLGIVLCVLSVQTVYHALRAERLHLHTLLLPPVAGIEAIAAILFLIPATMKIGGWLLLAILCGAFAFHALHGDPELSLLVYFTGVALIMDQR